MHPSPPPAPPIKPFEADLRFMVLSPEAESRFTELLEDARSDFAPRNFAERHLVDEMALARWRAYRTTVMEKAVFEHEQTSFRPRSPKDADGHDLEPHEDMYHLAMAHARDRHAAVLAALSRLEVRYHRQFCAALRLVIALRRGNPPQLADSAPCPKCARQSQNQKENSECKTNPSPSLQ